MSGETYTVPNPASTAWPGGTVKPELNGAVSNGHVGETKIDADELLNQSFPPGAAPLSEAEIPDPVFAPPDEDFRHGIHAQGLEDWWNHRRNYWQRERRAREAAENGRITESPDDASAWLRGWRRSLSKGEYGAEFGSKVEKAFRTRIEARQEGENTQGEVLLSPREEWWAKKRKARPTSNEQQGQSLGAEPESDRDKLNKRATVVLGVTAVITFLAEKAGITPGSYAELDTFLTTATVGGRGILWVMQGTNHHSEQEHALGSKHIRDGTIALSLLALVNELASEGQPGVFSLTQLAFLASAFTQYYKHHNNKEDNAKVEGEVNEVAEPEHKLPAKAAKFCADHYTAPAAVGVNAGVIALQYATGQITANIHDGLRQGSFAGVASSIAASPEKVSRYISMALSKFLLTSVLLYEVGDSVADAVETGDPGKAGLLSMVWGILNGTALKNDYKALRTVLRNKKEAKAAAGQTSSSPEPQPT